SQLYQRLPASSSSLASREGNRGLTSTRYAVPEACMLPCLAPRTTARIIVSLYVAHACPQNTQPPAAGPIPAAAAGQSVKTLLSGFCLDLQSNRERSMKAPLRDGAHCQHVVHFRARQEVSSHVRDAPCRQLPRPRHADRL